MSASPAPSVAGTSDVRPSVPPASPPPSRDQVVMGGQTSAGVTIRCHGSAPSRSVTMATSDVSDDVVPASSDLPPTSGGEGGQKKHFSPACSPIPDLSSTRPLSPVRREKRLDPSGSSLAGPPPRSPSVERQRSKRSRSPSSPSLYRSRSGSRERRERGSGYRQRSRERRDCSGERKRSRCSRSRSPSRSADRKHTKERSRSRSCEPVYRRERSRDRRDSCEYRSRDSPKRSLYRSRSRERAYRSRTPSERGNRSERYGKGATSLLGKQNKRSDVSAMRQMLQSVMSGFQKSLDAFEDDAINSSSAGASSRGSCQRRVCPRHVRVERLAPVLTLLPVLKSVSVRSGRTALRVDQTAPLVIVANYLPEREGAAIPRL